MFFIQKYSLFVSRSTLGKLSCGSNVLFKWTFLQKYKIIPTDLPKKMAFFSEFFHLMFFQLTLGKPNLQDTGENSSTYRKFELSEI